jgi:hypothetical protein
MSIETNKAALSRLRQLRNQAVLARMKLARQEAAARERARPQIERIRKASTR